jgi:hypothetical protein
MKNFTFIFIVAVFAAIVLSNCKHEPNDLGEPTVTNPIIPPGNGNKIDSICFADSISPLLNSSCARSGCHDDTTRESGINLSTYENVISTISGSLLLQVLQDHGQLGMPPPPAPKLTAAQIALIQRWVNEGMKNGIDCGNCPTDTNNFTFSGAIFPIMQNNCVGCHSGTETNLTVYDSIKKQALNGKLFCVINHNTGCLPMPKNGPKLCDGMLIKIKKWIDAGAPNN